jgi:gluconolactonase
MCEVQVLDDNAPKHAKLDPRQYNGSVYGMIAPHRGYLRPVGEWNLIEATVLGPKIRVELNGTRILDGDVSTITQFKDNQAHPGKSRPSGHFGFAGHNDPVAFRNIEIRKIEKLWGEGEFTEGPAEGPDGIYFSDIGNRILVFFPETGKTAEFSKPSGRSNGLKFDAMGRLIAAEGANTGGNRRISRTEKDLSTTVLADKYMGKRFNSPNDLTLDSQGRIYFTDPRYVGDEPIELPRQSVYRIDPDGTVTEVIQDVKKPNGLVISPDGKTLYVAESDPKGEHKLLAYPLHADGSVGKRKDLYDFGAERGIDGMTVAKDGTIIAAAGAKQAAGIYFFNSEGKKLDFLPMPEDPSNCCLAGADKKTLYITAGKSLYRVKLK